MTEKLIRASASMSSWSYLQCDRLADGGSDLHVMAWYLLVLGEGLRSRVDALQFCNIDR